VVLGATEQVIEEFYAISGERRLTDPAVVAIRDAGLEILVARPADPAPTRRRARDGTRKSKRTK